VPNIHLGKWGERNAIRILFPRLWNSGRANVHLSAEEQNDLYENCILPAVEALHEDTTDWPATYPDEDFRGRRINDGSSFRLPLSEWRIPLFGDRLREELKSHHMEWVASNFCMMFVPEATTATVVGLPTTFNDNDDNWWIDVGLELRTCSPGLLAFPRAVGKFRIMYCNSCYLDHLCTS
jgi:hypothetical protein